MSLRHRWKRVDAEHWVHWLLCTQTFLLVLAMLWVFANGWVYGAVAATVIPAALVGLSGWLTAAWRKERPWSWWVATILFGIRFAGNGLALLAGDVSWLGSAQLVFDGLLLTYLFHPDCRARIDPPAAPPADAGTAAAASRPAPRY